MRRIFDRFWRGDPSRARTTGGTGLGMAIVLADVRLHGGDISVRSQMGKGTWFLVTLPRNPENGPVNVANAPIRFSAENNGFSCWSEDSVSPTMDFPTI
ncbi:MAG: ATP-binding protein [Bifidobacterium sp.]